MAALLPRGTYWSSILLGLAACQRVFGFDEVVGADANGRGCFSDDFEGGLNPLHWSLQNTGAASGTLANGEIEVTLASSPLHSYSLLSTNLVNLAESSASIEIVERPSGTTLAEAGIRFDVAGEETGYMLLVVKDATIARVRQNFKDTNDVSTYNAMLHRFLRLRQSGTAMYFESSDGGGLWSNVHTVDPMPFDVSVAQVTIFAGTFQVEDSPGAARFDTFRMNCPSM